MLHAVVMAGGAGTRFWPLSRMAIPKQLLSFGGDRSLIQQAVDRLNSLVPVDNISIITNQSLVSAIEEQLPALSSKSIIGEPAKRDTAPCIGLAAGLIAAEDPDATMIVMPSDHIIQPVEAFHTAVTKAHQLVEQDPSRLITFGVTPDRPAETYGYIQRGESQGESIDSGVFKVAQFKEKPAVDTAKQYLDDGGYYWNSGIFVWKARAILEALEQYQPDMVLHINRIVQRRGEADFLDVLEREFTAIEGISIDYAVMEHHSNVLVIEAPFEWDDIGSWQALSRLFPTDANNNTVLGKHVGIQTSNSIIQSSKDHLIATIGVSDLIIVHTNDATLVANKQEEESVRELVRLLESKQDSLHL